MGGGVCWNGAIVNSPGSLEAGRGGGFVVLGEWLIRHSATFLTALVA